MNSDTATATARHMVDLGDTFFSQGAECLRAAYASLRQGDGHAALGLKKQAYRAFEGANYLYARGFLASTPRVERRRQSIRAVVNVSIYAFDPLPLPGSDDRAQESHNFKVRELLERGRAAIHRHQLTAAVSVAVSEAEMKRPILDKAGDWQNNLGYVVKEQQREAVSIWRNFIREACNCLSGWRVAELMGRLPGLHAKQKAEISAAFAQAVPV